MSSDLSRFLRAVKVLEKLAWKYEQKEIADALMEHCSARDRERVAFLSTYLDDIWHFFKKRHDEAEPHCRECGRDIQDNVKYDNRNARADARYCSPTCRQKAYRKRVAARAEQQKPKRNESYGSPHRERAPAVTAGPPIASMMTPSETKEALATYQPTR